MLQVRKLSIAFGDKQILRELSFDIADGEKVGLVGDNGAGKTTLMRLIAGELQPDSGALSLTRRGKSSICYIPQHLSLQGLLHEKTVLSFMLEGRGLDKIMQRLAEIDALMKGPLGQARLEQLVNERVQLEELYFEKEGYRAEADIQNILAGVGLGHVALEQNIATLSGGQKSRLALARLLFVQADLLLLDEPTNHIDEEAVAWLGGYLSAVRQTVLVISHLPAILDRVVGKILLLDAPTGQLKSYPGNYSQFLNIREKERITNLRTEEKLQDEIARQKSVIRTAATMGKEKLMHSREKVVARLEKQIQKPVKSRTAKIAFPVKTTLNKLVISAREISHAFGKKQVLNNVSLEMSPTMRLGIIGENGAGKTTLLRILAGALKPDSGHILRSKNLEIGWYRQELENLTDANSVMQEVESLEVGTPQALRSALAHFLFVGSRLAQKVGSLSRGERARLALCKIMLSRPNLLLLDEPTNHLDQASRASLMSALKAYQGAVIVVSHDTGFLTGIGVEWALHLPTGKSVRIAEITRTAKAKLGK